MGHPLGTPRPSVSQAVVIPLEDEAGDVVEAGEAVGLQPLLQQQQLEYQVGGLCRMDPSPGTKSRPKKDLVSATTTTPVVATTISNPQNQDTELAAHKTVAVPQEGQNSRDKEQPIGFEHVGTGSKDLPSDNPAISSASSSVEQGFATSQALSNSVQEQEHLVESPMTEAKAFPSPGLEPTTESQESETFILKQLNPSLTRRSL